MARCCLKKRRAPPQERSTKLMSGKRKLRQIPGRWTLARERLILRQTQPAGNSPLTDFVITITTGLFSFAAVANASAHGTQAYFVPKPLSIPALASATSKNATSHLILYLQAAV